MKKFYFLLVLLPGLVNFINAQTTSPNNDSINSEVNSVKKDLEGLKKLLVTGWIQTQFQYAQTAGAANFDGGNFAPNSNNRFTIRRGRVKFTYNGKNSQYVMQINGTERGLNLVELFGIATDPWKKTFSISAGIMNRPFGFEIDQSSAVRESPERSRYSQILMPNERDMGAKIIVAPPAGNKFHGFRLDAGFYNGQGIYVPGTSTPAGFPPGYIPVLGLHEFDSQKDFIGRICYYRDTKNKKVRYGLGASHYNGGNMMQSNRVYETITVQPNGIKNWEMSDTASRVFKGKTGPRIYYGAEAYFSVKSLLGTTTLRGEYITGIQSGTGGSSSSPFYLPTSTDTYVRNFNGMYAYFIQRLGESKHEVAVKYEWYDPNTKITAQDFNAGQNNFTAADIRYDQLQFGYNYYMLENVKFMVFYNIITNETTNKALNALGSFNEDLRDNIFTFRMQYRF